MEKNYENMGIYDLRNYARSMGVHSPTTLKRAELVERINEIINGKIPDAKKTNKGRPPRHKVNSEFILDFVLPNNLFEVQKETRYKTILTEKDKSSLQNILSEGNSVSLDNILFKGFFKSQTEDYGFACLKGYVTNYSKENAVVLSELSNKYQLKDGDYLVGVAKFIPEKNIMLALEINYVNDVKVEEKFDRLNYEGIMPQYPSKQLKLEDNVDFNAVEKLFPMAKGSRVCINFENEYNKTCYLISLLNSLSKLNDLRTVLISIDDSPEDIGSIIMSCSDVEVCSLSPNQSREDFFDEVFNYIDNCKNRLEFKQDVAIVFYNSSRFAQSYSQHLIISQNLPENTAKIMSVNKLKDIFNLSRSLAAGSLTTVLLDAPNDVAECSSCCLHFSEIPFGNSKLHLNIAKSYAKNVDKIFNEKACEIRQKIFSEISAGNFNGI